MGGSDSKDNRNFLNEWTQLEKEGITGSMSNVWVKKSNRRIQMEQYNLHVTSKEEVKSERRIHELRHNHPMLVSSMYFKDETKEEFCSSDYKGKIFLERIPLTLETITDIPFPDALHVYSQSLQGFHVLATQTNNGYFPVSEELIGVNSEGIVKVWMNNKYDRTYPSRPETVTEDRMIRTILNSIDQNVDFDSLQGRPMLRQYIQDRSKSPSNLGFGEAINLTRHYANEYFGGAIPNHLNCVDKVGGAFLLSKNWKSKVHENERNFLQRQEERAEMLHRDSSSSIGYHNHGNIAPIPVPTSNTFVSHGNLHHNSSSTRNLNQEKEAIVSQPASVPTFREDFRASTHNNQNINSQNHIVSSNQPPITNNLQSSYSNQPTPTFQNIQPSSNFIHTSGYSAQGERPSVSVFNRKDNEAPVFHGHHAPVQVIEPTRVHSLPPPSQEQPIVRQANFVSPQPRFEPAPTHPQTHTQAHFQPPQAQFVSTQNRFNESQIENRITNVSQPEFRSAQPPRSNLPPENVMRRSNVVFNNNGPTHNAPIAVQRVEPSVNQIQINRPPLSQSMINRNNVTFTETRAVTPNQPQAVNFGNNSTFQQGGAQINIAPQTQPSQNPQRTFTPTQSTFPSQPIQINPISHNQPEKVQSKIVFINDGRSGPQGVVPGRNEESGISSITGQLRSNEQISGQFSQIKEESNLDNSTRNFYTAYTNKLYEAGSESESLNNSGLYHHHNNFASSISPNSNTYGSSEYNAKSYSPEQNKYAFETQVKPTETNSNYKGIAMDDGMSSLAFLNELKAMKFDTKVEQVDLGNGDYYTHTTTLGTNPQTGTVVREEEEDYKVSYHHSSGINDYNNGSSAQNYYGSMDTYNNNSGNQNDNDLVVVGQKIQIDVSDKYGHQEGVDVYEEENYESINGGIRYESEYVQRTTQDGQLSSQTEYQQSGTIEAVATNSQLLNGATSNRNSNVDTYRDPYANSNAEGEQYQSYFDKYASYGSKNNISPNEQKQSASPSKTANNTTAGHNHNSTSQYGSYADQSHEAEEYKVEFDPEILADLQRLKGN